MNYEKQFDVIIIGGSYAGLSAAMTLGRALRNVLVIDSGTPCNRNTPFSHNFLTQDGVPPQEISRIAKEQVLQYPTIAFYEGIAIEGTQTSEGFEILTSCRQHFKSKKLIFATGLQDQLPKIEGFTPCWGVSILHCPYCHGYEVKHQKTAIIANGETAFELTKMISNWTKEITIFTNGVCMLSDKQIAILSNLDITIIESPIQEIKHTDGFLKSIKTENGTSIVLSVAYTRLPATQQCNIPQTLACSLTEEGKIEVNESLQTTNSGIWACGDCSSFRSVPTAVYTGAIAGKSVNKILTEEAFTPTASLT
ncbi:NAD(P)/FAD-dependent oxidoreductase [Aquimarina hainanensis]|uniref:NAD(P)/FAD-dependent oxidoreductase n=1 Tax=Aquimarina hainanensis TaxID=1578017 RepID=A0ABW5N7E3_9FLAO